MTKDFKRHLVILNGYAMSGKDTFINACIDYSHTLNSNPILSVKRSSIDAVKELAEDLGWNGLKTDKNRNMLSEFKDLVTKYFDLPFKDITTYLDKIEFRDYEVLYSCVRESEEIQKLVDWGAENNYKVTTVLVRGKCEKIPANASHSDLNVLRYEYDYIMTNNLSEEEFKKPCIEFVDNVIYKDR